ncbi:hypothetical protein EVAR_37378_1 [Eumeta japonica]|uniref:Uncharacterized protein n=1 Tax=Eumeta variegata TaxID=151549 RepID=A0A4C1ZRB2_EUMVA|nr:hypothetical protein EVAR_37378_1 [Eumeta japonica]
MHEDDGITRHHLAAARASRVSCGVKSERSGRNASATSATADGLAPEGASQTKKFCLQILKRGLAKSFAYKLLKRGLANLMSPTSTSGVAPPLATLLIYTITTNSRETDKEPPPPPFEIVPRTNSARKRLAVDNQVTLLHSGIAMLHVLHNARVTVCYFVPVRVSAQPRRRRPVCVKEFTCLKNEIGTICAIRNSRRTTAQSDRRQSHDPKKIKLANERAAVPRASESCRNVLRLRRSGTTFFGELLRKENVPLIYVSNERSLLLAAADA